MKQSRNRDAIISSCSCCYMMVLVYRHKLCCWLYITTISISITIVTFIIIIVVDIFVLAGCGCYDWIVEIFIDSCSPCYTISSSWWRHALYAAEVLLFLPGEVIVIIIYVDIFFFLFYFLFFYSVLPRGRKFSSFYLPTDYLSRNRSVDINVSGMDDVFQYLSNIITHTKFVLTCLHLSCVKSMFYSIPSFFLFCMVSFQTRA